MCNKNCIQHVNFIRVIPVLLVTVVIVVAEIDVLAVAVELAVLVVK